MTVHPRLCTVLITLVLPHAALAASHRAAAQPPATGTLAGIITDATSRRPLPHTLVTVGYLTPTFQRAAMTDARGRYVIPGLPVTRAIDTFAYAQGYFYHYGVLQTIRPGRTTMYSYSLPRDTYPLTHPRILSYYGHEVSPGLARFGMTAVRGQSAFSFEMMAISPQLGRLVVLAHGPGNRYDGTLHVPPGTKPGVYRFYFIATENDCFEPRKIPHLDVRLG